MEKEGSLPLLQKAATCHYIEQCCMTVVRIEGGRGIFGFHVSEYET